MQACKLSSPRHHQARSRLIMNIDSVFVFRGSVMSNETNPGRLAKNEILSKLADLWYLSVCLSACLLVCLLFYTRTWHNKQSETSSGVALTRCRVDSPPRAMSVPATSAPPCSSRSPRTLFSIYSSACTHSTIHRSLNSPVAISTVYTICPPWHCTGRCQHALVHLSASKLSSPVANQNLTFSRFKQFLFCKWIFEWNLICSRCLE